MTVASYNPETLNWIRNGATARDLGWDQNFYLSVCRKHGMKPIADASKTQATPEIAASVPIAPASPVPVVSNQGVRFHTLTNALFRDADHVTLSPRQAEIFVLIVKATEAHPATGRSMGLRLNLDEHGGIGGHIVALRKKTARLNIKIAAVAGRGSGGYFIVDQLTDEPLSVVITKGER